MNADWAPGGRQPSDQTNWLWLWVYHPHPPSPFVIITQPGSWYSFYRHTEGGRLSRPRQCRKGAQPMPKAVHRSGCCDKRNWLQPLTPQSIMPLLNHCDLLRHTTWHSIALWPGIELATIELQVQCPNHNTTEPRRTWYQEELIKNSITSIGFNFSLFTLLVGIQERKGTWPVKHVLQFSWDVVFFGMCPIVWTKISRPVKTKTEVVLGIWVNIGN